MHVGEATPPMAGRSEIRVSVKTSGVSPGEVRLRSGELRDLMPIAFPYRTGFDAAGVVDQIGDGVVGLSLGDEVFGMTDSRHRGSNADLAVLVAWAPKPPSWSWEEAGGAAGGVETAVRVLDRLGVRAGDTVVVNGAAGGTGVFIVQFAIARGATVIGTASAANHGLLRSLGAIPTTYGEGMAGRVRALAPSGVDAVVDCAGGALPELVSLVDSASRVVTIADFTASTHGVHLSFSAPNADSAIGSGADPLALHALPLAVVLAAAGRLTVPVAASFPLEEIAAAHELSQTRHARGKIVLLH
jgi:NADPH:quinone reductase-like Zn-dependent oxidoreductase